MGDGQLLVTTIVLAALGLMGAAAVVIGIVQLLKAHKLERRCTARAQGRVIDVIDRGHEGILAWINRPNKDSADEVVAANEAIAAKKRAYREKQRKQAQKEANEALATWHLVVQWTPAGADNASDAYMRTLQSKQGMRAQALRRVEQVEVRYDPSDPSCAFIAQEGTPRRTGLALVFSGAALIALCVICWFTFPALAEMSAGL